jgi:hypothetical protein
MAMSWRIFPGNNCLTLQLYSFELGLKGPFWRKDPGAKIGDTITISRELLVHYSRRLLQLFWPLTGERLDMSIFSDGIPESYPEYLPPAICLSRSAKSFARIMPS